MRYRPRPWPHAPWIHPHPSRRYEQGVKDKESGTSLAATKQRCNEGSGSHRGLCLSHSATVSTPRRLDSGPPNTSFLTLHGFTTSSILTLTKPQAIGSSVECYVEPPGYGCRIRPKPSVTVRSSRFSTDTAPPPRSVRRILELGVVDQEGHAR